MTSVLFYEYQLWKCKQILNLLFRMKCFLSYEYQFWKCKQNTFQDPIAVIQLGTGLRTFAKLFLKLSWRTL